MGGGSGSGASVHSTAVVEAGAELAAGVRVGPFAFIGRDVRLGERTEIMAGAIVLGPSTIGANNRIFPGAVVGAEPQDRSYRGEPTRLDVGDGNVIREHVTIHRGTVKGGGVTTIGDHCLLMAGAHVAHDAQLGNGVTLTNATLLGGHVQVGEGATCGGQVAVAPFVRLGRLCFVAGGARVERDVPPFVIVGGDRARVRGPNRVGLERAGVEAHRIAAVVAAVRTIWFGEGSVREGLERARVRAVEEPLVRELVDSVIEA